jgi:pimeloyl-ACP methyl ester carboxylesterase
METIFFVLRAMLISVALCGTIGSMAQESESTGGNGNAVYADCSLAQNNCAEDWNGRRTTKGKFQFLVLHTTRSKNVAKATVDLPDYGALDIPASKFAMKDSRIHFELVGDSSTTVFDGSITGDSIHGSWKDDDLTGSFELRRVRETRKTVREEEISFNNGAVRLGGTLLLPERPGTAPAIVFVHGSGPERRYASKFLAEFFVRQGIAALIYDKRGTGESSGDWKRSSFDDLAEDASAAVTFLKGRPEIDATRIGLMGSSQGGWIAPMAAARIPDLAFLIVKSAAAVTPEEQELARVERQMRAEGYSASEVSEALDLYRNVIAYARTGKGWDSLANEISADSEKKWALFQRDTPKDYWFFDQIRLTFDHDPIPVLQQVRSPVLVIYGAKDDDGPPLQNSVGRLLHALDATGKSSELEIFPRAGHDLRVVLEKGQEWDFPRFAPGYLDSLTSWVELHTKR